MVISYFGKNFIKVQFGDIVIAVDPISKNSSAKASRFGADICLISNNHEDCNGFEQIFHAGAEPFVIKSPGEYEIKDVFIKGFLSKTGYGGKERNNVIYTLALEGMNLCFVGLHNSQNLDSKIKEQIDDIDILFVPILGDGTVNASEGYKLAVSLEPKLIIPTMFNESTTSSMLKTFLKEGGAEKTETLEKLTIKKKDIYGKEGDIVVLKPLT